LRLLSRKELTSQFHCCDSKQTFTRCGFGTLSADHSPVALLRLEREDALPIFRHADDNPSWSNTCVKVPAFGSVVNFTKPPNLLKVPQQTPRRDRPVAGR